MRGEVRGERRGERRLTCEKALVSLARFLFLRAKLEAERSAKARSSATEVGLLSTSGRERIWGGIREKRENEKSENGMRNEEFYNGKNVEREEQSRPLSSNKIQRA